MPNNQHAPARTQRGRFWGLLGIGDAAYLRSPALFFCASASSSIPVSACAAVTGDD